MPGQCSTPVIEPRVRQAAFTLIELLIVIGIIAILVALLLPAVHAAREAARRTQCINKVRQLAVAVNNFEAAFQRLPLATDSTLPLTGEPPKQSVTPGISGTPRKQSNGTWSRDFAGYSWIVRVLPFMEEESLSDAIAANSQSFFLAAFDGGLVDNAGVHLSNRQIPFLRCPSFSGPDVAQAPEYKQYGQVAAGNYVCIPGTHLVTSYNNPYDPLYSTLVANGAIIPRVANEGDTVRRRGHRMSELTDGVSKTLVITESREQGYSSWYDGSCTWVTSLPWGVTTVKKRDGHLGTDSVAGPMHGLNWGPPSIFMRSYVWSGSQARYWGPSSQHSGGVVIHAFADARTVAISQGVDPNVYYRLCTIAGGEPARWP